MALRVKSTPTGLPTNSLYTPMDNTPAFSIKCVPRVVVVVVFDMKVT